MRKITLFFAFILPILTFSQSENLTNISWQCTNVVIDGEVIEAPNNDEVVYVILEMIQDNDPSTEDFISFVCNTLTSSDGVVTYNDAEMTFTISQLVQTLIVCDIAENQFFESNYFGFFYNNLNTAMSYEISTVNTTTSLTITAPNGDTANYNELVLSIEDKQLKKVNIYPNPATETITIDSKPDFIDSIELYSISGKILKSVTSSTSNIDISNLPKGAYFLKLYNTDNFIIKQFIKK